MLDNNQKPRKTRRLFQILGTFLLCVALILTSYKVTTAYFMDESVTSNGEPNIEIIGTVDLDVTTYFNFYNLVLAPDSIYTHYRGVDYATTFRTSEENDTETIYVRVHFETNREELTLYFEGNTTTRTSYDSTQDHEKWYYNASDDYYYYLGEVGVDDIEFNAGYQVDNTLINAKASADVSLYFMFESIQRPYGAYKAVWETAPAIFNEFARQNSGV